MGSVPVNDAHRFAVVEVVGMDLPSDLEEQFESGCEAGLWMVCTEEVDQDFRRYSGTHLPSERKALLDIGHEEEFAYVSGSWEDKRVVAHALQDAYGGTLYFRGVEFDRLPEDLVDAVEHVQDAES